MTSETIEGRTPAGGVKSTAFYQDDAEQPAEKDTATRVLIVEYDESGESIQRTYGTIGKEPAEPAAKSVRPRSNLPK